MALAVVPCHCVYPDFPSGHDPFEDRDYTSFTAVSLPLSAVPSTRKLGTFLTRKHTETEGGERN